MVLWRNSLGLVLRCFIVAVLAGGLALLSLPHALAQPSSSGAKRFGTCLASQKAGDLLLLFDESSSLQKRTRMPRGFRRLATCCTPWAIRRSGWSQSRRRLGRVLRYVCARA